MTVVLKPRRSNTPGAVPTTAQLADGELAINAADKIVYQRIGASIIAVASYGGGSGAAWGSITGTLSSQTDLATALSGKADLTGANFTGPLTIAGGSVYPLSISGAFSSTGRFLQLNNTDTSTTSGMGIVISSGATTSGQIVTYAVEATTYSPRNGRLVIENTNGSGVSYYASTATGTHQWYAGATPVLVLTLANNGTISATNGLNFGSVIAGSNTTFTNHLLFHVGANYGIGVTSGRLNYGVNAGGSHVFIVGSTDIFNINATNVTYNGFEVGFRQIPLNTSNAAYTFVKDDAGKGRMHTDTTARAYTLPISVFSPGDVITVVNHTGTGVITIVPAAGVTQYLAGSATTGTRTVAVRGYATIFCAVGGATPVFYTSGPGVT